MVANRPDSGRTVPDTLISILIVDSSSCACRLKDRQGPLMTTVVYGAVHTPFMGWRLQDNNERAVSLEKKKSFLIEICKLETEIIRQKTRSYVCFICQLEHMTEFTQPGYGHCPFFSMPCLQSLHFVFHARPHLCV